MNIYYHSCGDKGIYRAERTNPDERSVAERLYEVNVPIYGHERCEQRYTNMATETTNVMSFQLRWNVNLGAAKQHETHKFGK